MTGYRVWAPAAEQGVDLVLGDERVALERGDDGWWQTDRAPRPGERYAFSVDGGDPRPDPRSLSQPDGPHEPSEVVDLTAHEWGDGDWAGAPLEGAIVYELHIGTFTPEGTFDAAVEHLDHLADLGVTIVEVMPVAAFPGRRGWGYDGVDLFAVHEAYGGVEAFQRFVDACHQRGLGVCLDVVYNHLGPSGNYLATFGPYFTDAHHTPWGWAVNLDGPDSDEVRRFLLDNARFWFRDVHVDALRLDAVHALIDDRAVHFLEELAAETDSLSRELGHPLWLIAESDRNDPATVTPRRDGGSGGLGLHAQWADDVHHALHVLLTGETQGYYADFAAADAPAKVLGRTPFFHDGTTSTFRGRRHGRPVDPDETPGWRFVASLQTHDQVGNRATGDRLSQLVPPGRLAAGAALLLTSPYTPMLFMGEEWGASTPWQYFTDHEDPELARAVSQGRRAEFAEHGWADQVPDPQARGTADASTLRWEELREPEHARLLEWYATLIRLRRERPELRDPALGREDVRREGGVLRVRRGEHLLLVNLGDETLDLPTGGEHEVLAAWQADLLHPGAARLGPDATLLLGPVTSTGTTEEASRG
ncbi:maltooligosyltrehalose trehalohydrolase [Barrientosiimonas humi]|uniref:Malto-oligosyltrehalose trehalohydrolase n=1 Tax=Barrientosiimonas humi TaxID=999931 RepID=A0A542XF43_9MICO|nr:malto-oligosyltrehalose trehalohydrolase [Barrientosiimonas humi]TQL34444.1 maltooligosyltrehalose trehalohydrolase [Barrientosiimonas humi]CAG7574433.1 Malto-oligosyltrehalose trehalohydrolase [Barrientosiimonas humi]